MPAHYPPKKAAQKHSHVRRFYTTAPEPSSKAAKAQATTSLEQFTEAVRARQKPDERSLHVVNEHHPGVFNEALAASVDW
jgi:hypothetical protein